MANFRKVKFYKINKDIIKEPFFSKIILFGNIEKVFGNEGIIFFDMSNGDRVSTDLIQFKGLEEDTVFYDRIFKLIKPYILEELKTFDGE